MVVLLSNEITQHSISVRTELAVNLSVVMGDRAIATDVDESDDQ